MKKNYCCNVQIAFASNDVEKLAALAKEGGDEKIDAIKALQSIRGNTSNFYSSLAGRLLRNLNLKGIYINYQKGD